MTHTSLTHFDETFLRLVPRERLTHFTTSLMTTWRELPAGGWRPAPIQGDVNRWGVPNTDSIFDGISGNEPGVGSLPPGTPKKDILSSVTSGDAFAISGCPNCKVGGKSFVWFGSPGMGNCK